MWNGRNVALTAGVGGCGGTAEANTCLISVRWCRRCLELSGERCGSALLLGALLLLEHRRNGNLQVAVSHHGESKQRRGRKRRQGLHSSTG